MRQTCKKCESDQLNIGRTHIASGAEVFPLYCLKCGETQTQYVKRTVALAHEKEFGELKYVKTKTANRYQLPKCDVCGKEGAELHHWAPRHLFEDAESWPTSYLCVEHHKLWHALVTPNMSEKKS